MNKRQIGSNYEQLAVQYLEENGYAILERNYRNRYGEIDIIAKEDATWVYLEVKYRGNENYGDPLDAVDVRKQRQICRVAREHYTYHGEAEQEACRFDVIGIYKDGSIRHITNAFSYQ